MALTKQTGIKGFFARLFSKEDDKKNMQLAVEAVQNITNALSVLSQKVSTLNDSFNESKQSVASLMAQAQAFIPQNEIAAAKCEQNILGAITACSSACDSVLAGGDVQEFKKQLSALATLVTQRSHFKE